MDNPVISKTKLFQEIGYKPHEHQLKIHNSNARFLIPCCGRRFGKSQVAGHEITWRAMQPDQYIWIVGPTYKLGEKEYRVVYDDFFRKLKIPKAKKSYNVKQGDMRIELPWNTIIEVVSADKQDSLVGEGLTYACMSEAALHHQSTWDMFIRPALSDHRGGAIFPSTPRGHNWYKGLYDLGQDDDNTMYDSWRFPSWYNVVMYPDGIDDPEFVEIRSKVSDYFWDQEYGALFTSREGRIYKDWNPDVHVIGDYVYNPAWESWLGFDFGFNNPFCCYDIQVDEQDNVYVWREYQEQYKTTWEHAQILNNRENPPGYHIDCAAADPRGPDSIATLQMIMRIPIMANPYTQEIGHEVVARWLKVQESTKKPKLFISRNCPKLIKQMENLQTETVVEGKAVREGQKKVDDHGPDTIRYFFNEWALTGGMINLGDVYGGSDGYGQSEAEGFFIANSSVTLAGVGGYERFGR